MNKEMLLRVAGWVIVPIIMLLCPPPEGLSLAAWKLSAFYIAAIMGLICRPLPEPAVLLISLGGYAVFCSGMTIATSGYSLSGPWLVFTAFMIGKSFVDTGLGQRIAYVLVGKFGQTSLRLGYVAALTDLIISPGTPSNTARTGGIVLPIFRSMAVTLGSEPGSTARRIGGYFGLLLHYISLSTAAMFLTSNATNLMTLSFAQNAFGIEVNWGTFALALGVPGFFILLLGPWLVYKMYPPEITVVDNKKIADEGLAKLGPMSIREKLLVVFFVLALVLWSTTAWTKINSAAVALGTVGLLLFFRVMSWETLVGEKNAWSTFMWYGGILGLADGLAKLGYFKWLAQVLGKVIDFHGMHPVAVMLLLVAITFPIRYLFASLGTFVSTMVPVIYALAKVGGVDGMLAFVMLCPTTLYWCILTHYGNAVSPVLFGAGWVDQKTWWLKGGILGIIMVVLLYAIGLPWWKMLGYW